MKHNQLFTQLTGVLLTVCFAVEIRAQNPETETGPIFELPPMVVTPTKFPLPQEDVGSAITVIPGNDLEARQIRTVEDALKFAPGVTFASNGQRGSTSSVFLRGVNSNQTQLVVDGVRINDSNIFTQPFVGAAIAHQVGTIEVLRGPQSALYGGESIGGVISLTTPKGSGEPSSEIQGMAGSFGTWGSRISSGGEFGATAYSVSAGYDSTENQRPNSDFTNLYFAGRIDQALSEKTAVGFTFRGAERELGSPGSVFERDPNNQDRESFLLLTAYLDHSFNDRLSTRFITGWLDQDLDFDFPPEGSSRIANEKLVLDWRNTFQTAAGHTTLLGAGFEDTTVSNNGFGAIAESEQLVSLYLQQLLQVTEALSLTGGVRWEDYDSFGDTLNWRGAGAYHLDASGTTLRASAGTGFRAPSFFELFAASPSFVGNPDLGPEESLGWDVGLEQAFGEAGSVALTWFANELDGLITTDFGNSPSTVRNLEEASTSGLELAWKGLLLDRLTYQLAYTYLKADNDSTGQRLLRRPRHTLGFDLNAQVLDRLTLGAGGYWIDDRLDLDPATFETIPGDDYFLARFYGNYALNDDFDLFFRVENAFDLDYDEIAGFPGLGLGVFGGAKLRF